MAVKKIEDAIREYLDGVGKPVRPSVDREAVKALKAEIRGTSDPIAKLRLYSALEVEEAGRVPDTAADKAVFVAEAQRWAEGEGISASAFQALGVPDDVLKEAGFTLAATPSPATGGGRAPRVPIEEVTKAVRKLGSGWKLSDLASELDRDPATVRNYVNKLVDQGVITVAGDDPTHNGRGRAPKLYAAR